MFPEHKIPHNNLSLWSILTLINMVQLWNTKLNVLRNCEYKMEWWELLLWLEVYSCVIWWPHNQTTIVTAIWCLYLGQVAYELMCLHEECLQGKHELLEKLRRSTPGTSVIFQSRQVLPGIIFPSLVFVLIFHGIFNMISSYSEWPWVASWIFFVGRGM